MEVLGPMIMERHLDGNAGLIIEGDSASASGFEATTGPGGALG